MAAGAGAGAGAGAIAPSPVSYGSSVCAHWDRRTMESTARPSAVTLASGTSPPHCHRHRPPPSHTYHLTAQSGCLRPVPPIS